MDTIREDARDIPVVRDTDVLVAGGGPAGLLAALSAAHNGARVLLVERYGFLGGLASQLTPVWSLRVLDKDGGRIQITKGLAWAFLDRVILGDGGSKDGVISFPDDVKLAAIEALQEAGVELLLHTLIVDVAGTRSAPEAVILENKGGRSAIRANVFIDATGDGDLAVRAGAPYEFGRESDGRVQSMGMEILFHGVDASRVDWSPVREATRRGELPYLCAADSLQGRLPGFMLLNVTHVAGDGTDPWDLTSAEINGRLMARDMARFLRENVRGFEKSFVVATPPHIGVRESRRIVGEYVLSYEDVIGARKFPDGVARGSWFVDIHCTIASPGATFCKPDCPALEPCEPLREGRLRVDEIAVPKGDWYDIPYRCLVPKGVDNLLVAGRSISASHEAQASLRVVGTCMALGEAAGAAAALCVKHGVAPRDLDVNLLRTTLREQGVLLDQEVERVAVPGQDLSE